MIRPLTLALVLVAALPAYIVSAHFKPVEAIQAVDPKVMQILDEGKNRSKVMDTLRHITLKIGARATGSPELEAAEKWAVSQFKSYGCDVVTREQWGLVPGFQRGPKQTGRMVSPIVADFQFSTNVWTQGTNGPVRGNAVVNPTSLEQAKGMAKELKGAWLLMSYKSTMGGARNRDPKELKEYVDSCGIAGRVYPSNNELIHTHGSYKWKVGDKTVDKTPESHPMDVDVSIRKSDMDRIMRWLRQQPVTLEFNLENRWLKPIPQYNVVADIRGTEKPDEMVIIGGHLDSWNGPGSQGANDNGTGSAMTIEAARILKAVKAKPKRTIRFILWAGEEQGLLGSGAYAKLHEAEMDKISALINDDGGSGYHGGYSITEEMLPIMKAAVDPVNAAFPDMQSKLTVVKRFAQEMGSDHASYIKYGVPAFYTVEGGGLDYMYIWHTQNDRIENSVPKYLIQSATEAAAVAYSIANAETLLPRTKKPAAAAVKP